MDKKFRYYIVRRDDLGLIGDESGSPSLTMVNELLSQESDLEGLVVIMGVELPVTVSVQALPE